MSAQQPDTPVTGDRSNRIVIDAEFAKLIAPLQPEERGIWIASAVSIAASALNPNLFDALRVMQLYRASAMQRSLWEWQHTALWPLEPSFFKVALILALPSTRRVSKMPAGTSTCSCRTTLKV